MLVSHFAKESGNNLIHYLENPKNWSKNEIQISSDYCFNCIYKFIYDLELQTFCIGRLFFQLLSLFIPAAMGTASSYEDFNEMVWSADTRNCRESREI